MPEIQFNVNDANIFLLMFLLSHFWFSGCKYTFKSFNQSRLQLHTQIKWYRYTPVLM